MVKIRFQHKGAPARVKREADGRFALAFNEPQRSSRGSGRGILPWQAADRRRLDRVNFQLHTYGCKVNTYDSGLLETRLKRAGFTARRGQPARAHFEHLRGDRRSHARGGQDRAAF